VILFRGDHTVVDNAALFVQQNGKLGVVLLGSDLTAEKGTVKEGGEIRAAFSLSYQVRRTQCLQELDGLITSDSEQEKKENSANQHENGCAKKKLEGKINLSCPM
jgi:hypothetical protein